MFNFLKLHNYYLRSGAMAFLVLSLVTTVMAIVLTVGFKSAGVGLTMYFVGLLSCAVLSYIGMVIAQRCEIVVLFIEDLDKSVSTGIRVLTRSMPFVAMGFVMPMFITLVAAEPNPVYFTSLTFSFITVITLLFSAPFIGYSFGIIRE